jgi:beta-glucosidase
MKCYQKKEARLALAKTLAEEGIVMLKNQNRLLPLKQGSPVAVFGRAQLQTLIGGSGSGATSSEEATIILEEVKKAGLIPVEALESYYRTEISRLLAEAPGIEEARTEFEGLISSGMIYEIFGRYTPPAPEFELPAALVEETDRETAALCIIGRGSGGEECDRRVEEDYYLTKSERQMVDSVAGHFARVVLVLNINGFIDLNWIKEYPSIQAVLYMGTAGEQGAAALAGILTGQRSPSGKLSATMALSYEDYPSSSYFATNKEEPDTIRTYGDYGLSADENGSTGFEKSPVALYQEGIYVGYRYFDTFHKEVLYPFGYGLSYADFHLEYLSSEEEDESLILAVRVTNTGREYSGKEVVQIYVSAPEGRIEKPYQELIAYGKTAILAPGESEMLRLRLPFAELAVYEEGTASYQIEEGDYYIRVGNSSRNTRIIGKIKVPHTITTAVYKNRLGINPVNRGKLVFLRKEEGSAGYDAGEAKEKEKARLLCTLSHSMVCCRTQKEAADFASVPAIAGTLLDVKAGKLSMENFIAQFSVEELAVLVNGYGPGLPFGGLGSNFPPTITYENGEEIAVCTHPSGLVGYVSPALSRYGIPSVLYKDGPAGVQMIAWPTGMSMACTFNQKLLYEFGHACGTEAELLQVDSWLAPAVNIQRSPIGGRNFEYYSEDPRHTGYCGLAITLGVEENNKVTACPKHFAVNELETYRRGSIKKSYDALDSIVEERAARELYLKPFEMIVRGSRVSTIMTSFNKINGVFAAGNQELCIGILREEWGYQGIVVTDWGDMDIVVDGADAVAAGNDIIMPGGPPVIRQVLQGYQEGRCSMEDLRKAVSNLLYFIMNTASFENYSKKMD